MTVRPSFLVAAESMLTMMSMNLSCSDCIISPIVLQLSYILIISTTPSVPYGLTTSIASNWVPNSLTGKRSKVALHLATSCSWYLSKSFFIYPFVWYYVFGSFCSSCVISLIWLPINMRISSRTLKSSIVYSSYMFLFSPTMSKDSVACATFLNSPNEISCFICAMSSKLNYFLVLSLNDALWQTNLD